MTRPAAEKGVVSKVELVRLSGRQTISSVSSRSRA